MTSADRPRDHGREHAADSTAAPGPAGRVAMSALVATRDIFETFFEASSVGLALADLSTRYVRVNARYAELVGRAPEDLVGQAFSQQLHTVEGSDRPNRASLLLAGHASELQSEQRYQRPDGTVRWLLHGVTVVTGSGGQPAWFAVSAQDITERHAAEEELRALTATLAEQAVRDPLTGLANRMLLEERLRAVLARDVRTGQSTGLLFLDLDDFKGVNDRLGHLVGDAVLRALAERLTAAVRPSDTVARLGGDEFVILVEDARPDDVEALATRLREAVAEPLQLGEHLINVGVSIGIAVSVAGQDDPSTLLGRADRGMYAAKRARQRG
ncbi:MAG: sensor domain-containing diguanylate cyclase [Mycobacteriales bacterium]